MFTFRKFPSVEYLNLQLLSEQRCAKADFCCIEYNPIRLAVLTITVSEIQRDIGRKSPIFSYPFTFNDPLRGIPVGIAPPRLVWKN